MATAVPTVRIGPEDHGRPIPFDEFEGSDFEPGYKYELIHGRVYVTYAPNLTEDWLEKWLYVKVLLYSLQRPDIINFLTDKARVFVPSRKRITIPEPDIAAYHDFPVHRPLADLHWQDVSPFLVGEVLSANDPHKDLIRNVQLYLQVPTIREYWLIDGREDADRPTMRVYRRHGQHWRVIELAYRGTYTTKLLPGFKLLLDPHR